MPYEGPDSAVDDFLLITLCSEYQTTWGAML